MSIESFDLPVCAVTGEPGCMDCIEGQCPGASQPCVYTTAHRCTECDGNDVYGEMYHEPNCSSRPLDMEGT
jgi:hypothetical protein